MEYLKERTESESIWLWHLHRTISARQSLSSFTALFGSLSSRRTQLLAVAEAHEFCFLLSGKGIHLCLSASESHRRQILYLVGNSIKISGRSHGKFLQRIDCFVLLQTLSLSLLQTSQTTLSAWLCIVWLLPRILPEGWHCPSIFSCSDCVSLFVLALGLPCLTATVPRKPVDFGTVTLQIIQSINNTAMQRTHWTIILCAWFGLNDLALISEGSFCNLKVHMNSLSWKIKLLIRSLKKDGTIPELLKMKRAMRVLHMCVETSFFEVITFLVQSYRKISLLRNNCCNWTESLLGKIYSKVQI